MPQAIDLQRRCHNPGNTRTCLFRDVPHVILQGKDEARKSLTKRAAAYPFRLSKAITAVLVDCGSHQAFAAVCRTSHLAPGRRVLPAKG